MKNCNLAQVVQEQQAVVVQFPNKGRQVMSKKDVSYTRTPNYLVDENYVARMTGNALKCYTIINRFTEGFSRSNWAIDSTFLLEKTGIKKPHTAYDAVKQLEEFGLVSVHREDGRTNKFTITHPCLKTAVVPNLGSTEKGHGGDAEKGHTPTAEKRHTKKESIQKENIKSEEEDAREKIQSSEQPEKINTSQFFVEYKNDDWESCSFKQVTEKYPSAIQDFIVRGQTAFPDLSRDEIFEELKKMSTWSVSAQKRTAQKWMVVWLNKFLPQVQERKAGEQRRIAEKQAENNKPSALDVNAYFADQLAENKLDPNFVPTLVLGEEFN